RVYALGENPAQLGRDRSELDEFIVVCGVGSFHIRQIDDTRPQRRELRGVGAVAHSSDAASDRSREKERSIVLGENDVERLLRLTEAAQLRFEHIDVDIGRGEYDRANLADVRQVAR